MSGDHYYCRSPKGDFEKKLSLWSIALLYLLKFNNYYHGAN